MSTKPKPQAPEEAPGEESATFKQLPEKTKELMKLKDQEEKTTGPGQIEIRKEIDEMAAVDAHGTDH